MATAGIEEVTENAIRAVARDCGSLSIECSDVAGYVEGVAERIGEHLKVLDGLEEVTTRLLADQARVSDSTDEARLLSEQAKAKLEAGREASDGTSEIKTGVERSRTAQAGFSQINDTVKEVTEIVSMVDRQTEGIAHSTSLIQTSVDRMKAGLSEFAGDARDNGGQLIKAQKRLSHLEMLSNNMLDTLANSGAEIDDTPMILLAQEAMRAIAASVDQGVDRGDISMDAVHDRNYVLIEGTNPPQYNNGFADFADKHVRPLLDRFKARETL